MRLLRDERVVERSGSGLERGPNILGLGLGFQGRKVKGGAEGFMTTGASDSEREERQ